MRAAAKKQFMPCGEMQCKNEKNSRVRPIDKVLCSNSNLLLGVGTMETVSGMAKCKSTSKSKCRKNRCANFADVVLESKDYCLAHFIDYCYERLEMFDPLVRARSMEPAQALAARKFLQECSSCAVVVCFCHTQLTVSDRPRLLQILLWSEDLQRRLRRPGIQQPVEVTQIETALY